MLERFLGSVEGGKLVIRSQKALDAHLASFPDKTDVFVTVKKARRNRSLPQNNYYFGVVLALISEHTGHSVEELHEIMKRLFLPPRFVEYRGKELKMPSTTTSLNTLEFADYLSRVIAEAASLGVVIPNPDQVEY